MNSTKLVHEGGLIVNVPPAVFKSISYTSLRHQLWVSPDPKHAAEMGRDSPGTALLT